MSRPFAIASFLARWRASARYDLTGSDSETLPLTDLLALAGPDDLARWERLVFHYAEPLGAPWLRDAIARRHQALGADDIVCCAGAQEAVFCVSRAILSSDDHAIVVLPLYQPSEEAVSALCATTGVPLESSDWQLDIARVAAAVRPNTKLVLTNFPNSPTGAALDPAGLAALVALCRRKGLWLVNDEVYRQTDGRDQAALTVADVYERGISINGLSKGFGLPGLRVGWAACRDPGLRDRIVHAKSATSTCISSLSEVLAHIALENEHQIVSERRAIGFRNRQRLEALLAQCDGVFAADTSCNVAFGFPRYVGAGSVGDLAERLVRETGVLVLPYNLWTSPLCHLPGNYIRISLGHAGNEQGLVQFERFFRVAA